MGAVIALGFALARPQLVDALVVCNAATSYALAPVSLVAPLLPRIPQRIYSSLSGVVSPLFGRSGWTDGLAGSSDRGPGALLASGGALAAALPPATLAHRERDVVRRGAASVNAALDRLKGAAPPWSARAVFVASGGDAVLPSVSESRRLARLCDGAAVRVEPGAPHVLFEDLNLLSVFAEAGLLPDGARTASAPVSYTHLTLPTKA